MKHFFAALTAIRRAPYQALAALLILMITFFVGYTFSLIVVGTNQVLAYFETRPQVTAFFTLDTAPSVIDAVAKTMRDKSYVNQVTVITKEQALDIYRQQNKRDPLLLELVTADILPASVEVSAKDPQALAQISDDLRKHPGVDDVIYQKDVIDALNTWTTSLRSIGISSVIVLGFTSFLIIVIISGMKVTSQRNAIKIKRILGASAWYVLAPFVYEGMCYGIVGSLAGWGIMNVGLLYLTPWLHSFLGSIPLFPVPLFFLVAQGAVGTVLGAGLGVFASLVAVHRMMRHA